MDDKKFVEKLVSTSLLSATQADKLLREAEASGKRVEDLIYERRLIDEEEVAKVKSELLGVPYKKVNSKEISDDVLKLLPEETVNNYRVVPLGKEGDMLVVGMVSPKDRRAQEALRFIAKRKHLSLGVYLITPAVLENIIRRYSPFDSDIKAAVRSLQIKPSKTAGTKKIKLEEAAMVSEEAPIIKIVASALKEAVAKGASDLHIEPQKTRVRIRFRINGDLEETGSLPSELQQPIISRIKIMSNLKIDETRVPQDGRFRTEIFGRDIDFRVSTFPTPAGEKAAIRVLDPKIGLRKLEELGLNEGVIKLVEKNIKNPFGMILITGPTGSGKTTTLYAVMQELNQDNVNVVSLEDPVEYLIEGVNQSQVRPEIGYDFASGLRQILRQDPDIMMVGEIRDSETASLAVDAALTGHIVLSTLHTNDAVGVIPRLIDMKVDAFLLPSTLSLMLSQRLISKIDQDSKQASTPPAKINEIIEKEVGHLRKGPYKIWHSPKKASGRIGIFEVLQMTPELEEIINTQSTEHKIREEAKRQNMLTLRQDGILKALDGLVTIEEVLRETSGD